MKLSFDRTVAGGGVRRSPGDTRRRQRGVALVVTLLMLSVITFMAVTFLVLSQRERSSVNGATDSKIARNADDAATARACSELLTHMLLQTNFQDFDLLVSTNYINRAGFNPAPTAIQFPTNVNYDYELGGIPYGGGAVEWERNIASLLYNPRAPVFVVTNRGTGAGEFRFYLDLNRNGRFDANGDWPVVVTDNAGNREYLSTNAAGQIIMVATNSGGWVISNSFVGDPEWIGQLERPDELHSADNRFIARYAYIIVPVGKTLDVNYSHNRAKRLSPSGEGFLRNQGVGTWEINLAAFLADLNTNAWWNLNNYIYNTSSTFVSTGSAFTNANDLLNYRYDNNYFTLPPARAIFTNNAAPLASADIDAYSDGPLMLFTSNNASFIPDDPTIPWSGADNANHFFSQQDLFDPGKVLPPSSFETTLANLGTSNDTYNAYTFYRMLAQLGTDSSPDRGKINVNYKNTDINGNIIPGLETNLAPWTPIDFFATAATAMFNQMNMRDFNGNLVTLTNIPIYETNAAGIVINYYTPAVHRILQLAANMYDATTNRYIFGGPTNYPSVFRPMFRSQDGVVSIAGYVEVTNALIDPFLPFVDPQTFSTVNNPIRNNINMYGVPWVIGAKKGFPNFNEMSMENPFTVSRKLQFTNNTARPPWITNQLFDFSITNSFGVEMWNSYTNMYGRPLRLVITNEVSVVVTNQFGVRFVNATNRVYGNDLTYTSWPGWTLQRSDNSFQVPLLASEVFTNGTYLKQAPWVMPLSPPQWDAITVPRMWVGLQFKLRCWLIDTEAQRVIDFVNIVDTQPQVDISSELAQDATGTINLNLAEQWATNSFNGGALVGIMNQIFASEGFGGTISDWKDTAANIAADENAFKNWINNGGTNNFQAPYTPTRTVFQRISLQANDPLVHYTLDDLTSTNGAMTTRNSVSLNPPTTPLDNLTNLNLAYQPWGGNSIPGGSSLNPNPQFDVNYQVKDPLMLQSDDWDFPTNKLPNIGWLGRIHRGTPWQTVYMKPANMNVNDWRTWDNDKEFLTNGNVVTVDAALTHPTADYGLFDLFTTAINENASRGRLDVNQTNLAAWSAVLGGVNVLSNTPTGPLPLVVSPAGVYDAGTLSPLAQIWQAINDTRSNTNSTNNIVFLNHTFQHLGDVLATPQLTVASPFLNTNLVAGNPHSGLASSGANGINDEIMERIPQQVMSLLTLNQTPRFVIYSFGQTLHPADHSLVIGGTFNGLCTNYQITAESANRAVVRVEGTSDPQYTNDVINPHPDPQGRFYPPHIVVEQFNVLGPD